MRIWSTFAIALWGCLLIYTGVVAGNHGMGLLPVFFGDMAKFDWPGQFNADFTLMLFTSASWTMWRGRFRPASIVLGIAAFFMGVSFLLPYLVWLISRHRGDMASVLLGPDYARNWQ